MDELAALAGDVASARPIPDKLYFRIGEVSRILGVQPYVLRYWETEFQGLSPKKSSSGQRMFRRKDVELLLRIRDLLYEKKFTIEGARKVLAESSEVNMALRKTREEQQELFTSSNPLPEIRRELVEILKLVSEVHP